MRLPYLSWRSWLVIVAALSTAIMLPACRSCSAPHGTGAQVHGLIYSEVTDPSISGKRQIFVPDVTVFLKDVSTSAAGPKVTTNSRGFYMIPRTPTGKYELCWEAPGFEAGCTGREHELVIESSTVTPPPIGITPKPPVLFGPLPLSPCAPRP